MSQKGSETEGSMMSPKTTLLVATLSRAARGLDAALSEAAARFSQEKEASDWGSGLTRPTAFKEDPSAAELVVRSRQELLSFLASRQLDLMPLLSGWGLGRAAGAAGMEGKKPRMSLSRRGTC